MTPTQKEATVPCAFQHSFSSSCISDRTHRCKACVRERILQDRANNTCKRIPLVQIAQPEQITKPS